MNTKELIEKEYDDTCSTSANYEHLKHMFEGYRESILETNQIEEIDDTKYSKDSARDFSYQRGRKIAQDDSNKKRKIKFNLNHYVYVKLTMNGYKVLRDDYNSYQNFKQAHLETYLANYKSLDDVKKEADSDGYTKLQMHEFIDIFNVEISKLYVNEYFDLDILIEVGE